MTVFPDGTKEPLHGHNYQIGLTVELTDASLKNMVSYSSFKDILKVLAAGWDEKLLIQEKCPYYEKIGETSESLEFKLCGKRYAVPKDEVCLLPIENITTELLSREITHNLIAKLEDNLKNTILQSLSVLVEESGGQGSSFVWINPVLNA